MRKVAATALHPSAHGRLLIGLYWNDRLSLEVRPSNIVHGSMGAIHWGLSEGLLASQRRAKLFPDVPTPPEDTAKSEFIDYVNRYESWIRTAFPDVARRFNGNQELAAAQLGNLTFGMVKRIVEQRPQFHRPAWHRELNRFPDRAAIARWTRIALWYALRKVIAPEQSEIDTGQNYDDAHYVFCALYTKHLWTQDRGMRTAALAVSGGQVRVHSTIGEVQSFAPSTAMNDEH